MAEARTLRERITAMEAMYRDIGRTEGQWVAAELRHALLAHPAPAGEPATCACGDVFPADSYGAGYVDARGHCANCDAAAGEPQMPEPEGHIHGVSHWGDVVGPATPYYTADQLRAYGDARAEAARREVQRAVADQEVLCTTHAGAAAPTHEVYLAATEPQPMPAGWVPLTIEWEAGYPEEVAFGPKHMMDRLAKWLGKHLTMVAAEVKREAAGATQEYMRGFNDAKAQLSKDTERLDWLQTPDDGFYNIDRISAIVGCGFFVASEGFALSRGSEFDGLRAAVDAARAATPGDSHG